MKDKSEKAQTIPKIVDRDQLLEKQDVAHRLQISTRTLDQWMREGRIPFFKIGKTVRFRWEDVLAHLDQKCRIV